MKAATDPNATAVAPNAAGHLWCLDVLSVISLKVLTPWLARHKTCSTV